MEPTSPNQPQDESPVTPEQDNVAPVQPVPESPAPVVEQPMTAMPEVEPSTQAVASEPASSNGFSAPSTPFAKPPKKKRLLAIIIAVILVVLIGGGASAYFLWYQKPEKVLADAMVGLVTAKNIQSNTVITSDSELSTGPYSIKVKKITLGANSSDRVNGQLSASMTMTFNGRDYTIAGQAIMLANGDLYFQLNNIKELVQQFINTYGQGTVTLSAQATADLGKLQDKWVKVSATDMGESSSYECTINAFKKYSSDKNAQQEIYNAYQQHPFVISNKQVASKGGNLGYEVTVDKTAEKKFADALKSTDFGKQLAKCGDTSSTTDTVDTPASADGTKTTVTVWVSRFSHQLKAADYVISSKDSTSGNTVTFNGHTDIAYDKSVSISAPADSESLTQWTTDANSLTQDIFGMSTTSDTSSSDLFSSGT